MAEQAEREDDTDELELTELAQAGDDTTQGSQEEDHIEGDPPEDEVEVSFGDEAAPASNEGTDSGLVRKLRAEIRERDARLATLNRGDAVKPVEVGEKPTLAECDYDETRFETELDAWRDRKVEAEKADAQATEAAKRTQTAWAEELQDFGRKKAALKARDFEAAEEEVVAGLTQVQQAIVIKAADDSAKVIYALGKHPAKLAALAAIEDPIKFAVAVSKLEGTIKVTTGRKAPDPEGIVKGSAQISAGSDKHLERLEKDAERTGDRTKVVQYKREQRLKGKS